MRADFVLDALEWVSWLTTTDCYRLLEPIGYIPPAEAEENYCLQSANQTDMTV